MLRLYSIVVNYVKQIWAQHRNGILNYKKKAIDIYVADH